MIIFFLRTLSSKNVHVSCDVSPYTAFHALQEWNMNVRDSSSQRFYKSVFKTPF